MKDVIFSRKSCRSYLETPLDPSVIQDALCDLTPLHPEISVEFRTLKKAEVRSICRFLPPQIIAAYSERKDGYLENIGFLLQQVDLRLQKQGIGVCWIGLGKPTVPNPHDKEFVILLAVGTPNGEIKRSKDEFARKSMHEISDQPDPRLEPARFAPSAVNSQPWYFAHDGEILHVYRVSPARPKALTLGRMNQIDMGIALCHLYVSNPNTFRFFSADAPKKKGYVYLGSISC
ncbi:MAG: nitroreductase [Oscillospiraceae bacterium]|nr:nitroreductase [Oscillospiraceae bacterium]